MVGIGQAKSVSGEELSQAAYMCPKPLVINKTLTWTRQDATVLYTAKAGCQRHYGRTSCIKVFKKTRERDYEVTCITFIN